MSASKHASHRLDPITKILERFKLLTAKPDGTK